MVKAFLQFLVIVILFFATWFGLSKIHWVSIFKLENIGDKTEKKLGDTFWESIKVSETEIKDTVAVKTMDSLLNRICKRNDIDKSTIKLHMVERDDVNAFALPDNHLVVYSGLIEACDNEAELCGVLGHEIAHMQKHHVMKKLIKEVGLSALITITSGGKGAQVTKELLKFLSSTAYDRQLEKEADISSVDLMVKANIDPEQFANFLYRLADKDTLGHSTTDWSWISTHPDSKERGKYLVEYIKTKYVHKEPVLDTATWNALKEHVKKKD